MDIQRIKILLVEDDPLDRRQVRMVLAKVDQKECFNVDDAATLSQACERLVADRYDIVLLDLNLGDSSGIDTVVRIRDADSNATIIVLTGLDDEKTGLEAIKNGADDYIVKGDTLRQILVRTIRYSLERRCIRQQLLEHRRYLEQMVSERTANLEKANRQLRQEIEDRKRVEKELLVAKRQAEAANEAKSEFLANISHELRTPLHSILSFASFGVKKYASAEPHKLLDYFKRIKQSGATLLNLLNNLLDLAKFESRRATFSFEPTDLDSLVKSVMAEMYALLLERDLTIRIESRDLDQQVSLDPERIQQVLRNLLNNAIKFSPKGGVIDVRVEHTDAAARVSVSDRGPGIPEDELEAVFDKFVQSSKTKTGAGGTGLGLSICHEIIAAHRGRIWAENRLGGGTIFSLEIPLCHHSGRTNVAQPAVADKGAKPDVEGAGVACHAFSDSAN